MVRLGAHGAVSPVIIRRDGAKLRRQVLDEIIQVLPVQGPHPLSPKAPLKIEGGSESRGPRPGAPPPAPGSRSFWGRQPPPPPIPRRRGTSPAALAPGAFPWAQRRESAFRWRRTGLSPGQSGPPAPSPFSVRRRGTGKPLSPAPSPAAPSPPRRSRDRSPLSRSRGKRRYRAGRCISFAHRPPPGFEKPIHWCYTERKRWKGAAL